MQPCRRASLIAPAVPEVRHCVVSDACLAGTDNCDSGVHRTPDTCDGGSASDWTCDCSAGWSWVAATNACAADDCEPLPTSGAGFGGECAELVTDMSCTQTCTVGYFVANNGIGVMTCSDGTLDTANQIACQGMYHLRCCGRRECSYIPEKSDRKNVVCFAKYQFSFVLSSPRRCYDTH